MGKKLAGGLAFSMPRKIIIHKSLYRPALFVGCERLPFTLAVTIGGVIMMAYQNLWVFAGVLIYYLLIIILIRRVNENDPQFFLCLARYVIHYADYYPANEFYPGKADIPYSYFK